MENLWPGAYSFKFELADILKSIKNQIDLILEKIEKADSMTIQ